MSNFLLFLFNLPSYIWGKLFSITINTFDQLYIISPNHTALDSFADQLPPSDNLQYALNKRVVINNHYFELNDNAVAFIMTRQRWWRSTPEITVSIIHLKPDKTVP